ncbi:MAG: SDR family oxidoreductase, partial [bacterium]
KGLLGSYLRRVLGEQHTVSAPSKEALNISDTRAIEEYLNTHSIDYIINAAGMTNVYMCEKKREKAMEINAHAPGRIASLCSRTQRGMIYFSTNFIFDGEKNAPYIEEDTPNPLNVYAESKLAGENAVLKAHSNALIIRSAEIFGVGNCSPGHNIPYYIVRQIMNRRTIHLYDIKTSPTYALDIARRIGPLMENDISGILHLVNEGECTYFEIADMIFELMKRKTDISPKKSVFDFDAPTNIVMESSRIGDMPVEEMPSLEHTLEEFIQEVL